jgi:hypothetical protein
MFYRACSILFAVLCAASFSVAQPSNGKPTGDYAGMLGPYHIKLHLNTAPDGSLTATVDSPDANIFGMPCANFSLNGPALSFNVPMVKGTWSGMVSGDGSTLTGMWMQAMQGAQTQPAPLTSREATGRRTRPARQ